MGSRHVLGDHATDAAQGLAASLPAGGSANVVLGDAPARPGPRHGGEVDAMLLRNAPHNGRCLYP
jgi:hypothetical protein